MKRSNIYNFSNKFEFSYSNNLFKIPETYKAVIYENWEKAAAKNKNLFNGTVICLNKISNYKNKIYLDFIKSDYAHFIAAETGLLPDKLYPRIFYVSALIETTDNLIAFEKTGEFSFDTGRLQFIGGGLDERYVKENSLDYFSCIKNEITEELGICFNPDIHYLKPLFISFEKNAKKISIVFHFKPNMNSIELISQLNKHNANLIKCGQKIETASFVFTDKNNYMNFFHSAERDKTGENLFSSLDAFFTMRTDNIKSGLCLAERKYFAPPY